ncbi:MAG: tRNA (adenosine(37)-N6)-dimethylallyltransferase MiaA [Planctomycetota bacterium]
MDRFLIIAGPTAGGKSRLAVEVAHALAARGRSGEVISADSMQVYRGLDIGSAKPTGEEQASVRHHLLDVVEPTERFTVHDWLGLAEDAIAEIRTRGAVPIVAGGTHFYIKALLEGLFQGPEPDEALRAELQGRPLAELREELERVDPVAAGRIHPNDDRRTVRALEVYRQTGTPISELQQQWDREKSARDDALLVGLDWPTEAINRRINARVKQMMEQGLLEETRGLVEAGRLGEQARAGLGYKQLARHLAGGWTLDEAVEQIKIETRRFAKNQRTWLRRLRATPGSVWIDAGATDPGLWAGRVIEAWAG